MKCTIIIEDDDAATGTCTLKLDFEPPIEQAGPGTPASHLAMKMMEAATAEVRKLTSPRCE